MTSDYWHGVNAALEGCVFNFKKHRPNDWEYLFQEPPVGDTAFSQSFINGYMSVLHGEHFGWGTQTHLFDDTEYNKGKK